MIKITKQNKIFSQGFTLIEILVSSFLVVLITGGIVSFSMMQVRGIMRARAEQKTVQNARYAIEKISKIARMSKSMDIDGNRLCLKENRTNADHCFTFNANKLTETSGGTTMTLVTGEGTDFLVKGGFYKIGNSSYINSVEVNITLEYNKSNEYLSGVEKNDVTVQSIVSLRDYDYSNQPMQ